MRKVIAKICKIQCTNNKTGSIEITSSSEDGYIQVQITGENKEPIYFYLSDGVTREIINSLQDANNVLTGDKE